MQKQTFSGTERGIIAIAVLTAFAIWAPLFAVPPMESILASELSLSHFQSGILFSGPILMLALAAIPAGLLSDAIGTKKTAGIGLILVFIGAALRAAVSNYYLLLVFSVIYGIGMGFIFPNLPKLARLYAPPGQTFLVMGILNGIGLLGGISVSLAFTISPVYNLTNSYSAVFFIWSLPALAAAILWWIFVKDPPYAGSGNSLPSTSYKLIVMLLRDRTLWLLAILLLLHNYFFYSWSGWMPSYLAREGFDAATSGLITSMTVWAGIATMIVVSFLSSSIRMPRKPFIWIPSMVFALCAAAVFFIAPFFSWFLMALVGILNILRFNTLLTLPVELMPHEAAGTASGVVLSIGYLGAVIGPLVSGMILDITGRFEVIFWVLIFVSVLTMLLALLVPPVKKAK